MILQNILKPDDDTCQVDEMYWHMVDDEFLFDAYFNVFSIRKWLEYTMIRSFTLSLRLSGKVQITIYDQDGELDRYTFDCGGGQLVKIPLKYKPSSICIWFGFRPLSTHADLLSGYYETKKEPTHRVHLAGDICTFKRDQYVINNVNILLKQLIKNNRSSLHDRFDLFVIDNGQTLQPFNDPHIHLYPNTNAGGTGGFTRGLIEINKQKEELGITHVILMDDDAILLPDSFVRTYGLLSYVNKKYEKACLSGALLRMDKPYQQHEYGSHWHGTSNSTRYPGLDLRVRDNVIENEQLEDTDYSPWWYACYPIDQVKMDNLPIPFFLHMDDVEYGLRHKENKIILLNGICVWGPGFENKRASSLSYFDPRNVMIMNAIHEPDGLEKQTLRYLQKYIMADIMRYRYEDVKLIELAMKDFLAGPHYIGTLDPMAKLKEVNDLGIKLKPVTELTDDPIVLKQIDDYKTPEDIEQVMIHRLSERKKFYQLSLNGWLFKAKGKETYIEPLGVWPSELYRKKKVIFFDPENKKGYYGEKSWRKLFSCIKTFMKVTWQFKRHYKQKIREYKQAYPWLTSEECWENYLHLQEDKHGTV